jgi:DNA-binding CsgD family transcriptional regulator
MSGAALLERDGVNEAVGGLVDAVGRGQPDALFVVGEAGLGKTAVLASGRDRAATAGLTIGFGRGHPMEGALPFGVLVQVLDGLGGHGLFREDQPAPSYGDERAARFFGVLRWLERRDGPPVLIVIDDLHWADADSLALTLFLCRRLPALRAGLLASLRPWPAAALDAVLGLGAEDCARTEHLAPLTTTAAATLLQARAGRPVAAETSRRAARLCAGNPLLLEQLAMAIGRGEEVPYADGTGRPAVGAGLLLARFAGLPAEGMRCARAAAVLGTRFAPEVAARVAELDGQAADTALESLLRSGLIEEGPGPGATFIHPLFRQALYDDLGAARRARLHARAYAVFAGRGLDATAAEHAVQADLAGDMNAVTVLMRAADGARRSGALAVAVAHLDAAVVMAGARAGPDLLLAQADALLSGGRPGRAATACRSLLGRPALPAATQAQAQWLLGRALTMNGGHERAHATFVRAADLAETADPATAVEVLLNAAFAAMLTAGPVRALPIADRARRLAGRPGTELRIRADALWGEIALLAGDPAGEAAAAPAAPWRTVGQQPGHEADLAPLVKTWGLINAFAYSAVLTEHLADADRAFTAVRQAADEASDPLAMSMLAIGHSYALTRMGRLDEALALVQLGHSLVDLVPVMDSWASVGIAYIQLYRGDRQDSAHWCEAARSTATARGEHNALLFVWDVLGHRRLREGAVAGACECYERLETLVQQMGMGEPCLPPWSRHAIAAYVAAGRAEDAERVLAWLSRSAQRLPCRYPRIAAAVGRAQLAESRGDRQTALGHFEEALALHRQVDLPLEQAETLLDFGGFLRRYGQPTRARRVLAQAIEVAQAAQAGWLAELAHTELRVAGGRRRRPAPSELTAQETRVATLAAAGATSPEIARQLSVSPRTVETHLQRVYAKLGIRSRHELITMALFVSRSPDVPGSAALYHGPQSPGWGSGNGEGRE